MKIFIQVLFVLFLLPVLSGAQPTIGGQINTYTAVLSVDPCPGRIEIADAGALLVGQQVLVIQMQGAVINQQNNASYGTITNLNNAGRYEFNRILSITGNTLQLEGALLHDYDLAGQVQVVSVPEYESVIVQSDLIAAPWDGQTGGVLALQVTDTLVLQADLEVSGSGFRGGQVQSPESDCIWFLNENDYAYEVGNWRGSWKGEGVTAYIGGEELGRGALANGGGGGNDHNTGGGGGALLTAGGSGGLQSPPSVFGCGGDYPGVGGKALTYSDQLWMGGGGGAGHTDDLGAGSAGGNGGGILILQAGYLEGNGFALRANGAAAADASGDGAGGGGAGGTIVVLADAWDGSLSVSAKGGQGGDTDNVADRCFGPGGGGSGGAVFTNLGSLPDLSISGGLPGENENTNSNCTELTNGAMAGQSGIQEVLTEVLVATDLVEVPAVVEDLEPEYLFCLGEEAFLMIEVAGADLNYQWMADLGNGMEELMEGSDFSGTSTNTLQLVDPAGLPAGAQFQCLITSPCFSAVQSGVTTVVVEALPVAGFSFVVDDLEVTFTADPGSGGTFMWDFGDGEQDSLAQVVHEYAAEGVYVVELTVSNGCGTVSNTDTVFLGALPVVDFNVNLPGGCAPLEVQFSDVSSGAPTAWLWSFPGGDPTTSTQQNPVVQYADPGLYEATLEATNLVGSTSLTITGIVEVLEPPQADFTFEVSGDTVVFTNTSAGDFASVQWVFGDGSAPSEEDSPEHVYPGPGVYEVTLSVTNAFCGSFVTLPLEVIPTTVGEEMPCEPRFWPNPAREIVYMESCYPEVEIRIFDVQGQQVGFQKSLSTRETLVLNGLPAGVYAIEVRYRNNVWREKLVLY
jgi:PKD repeat protein